MSDVTKTVERFVGRIEEGAHREEPVEWWYVNSIISAPEQPFDRWTFVTIFTSFRNVIETVHGLLIPPEGDAIDLSGYDLPPESIVNATENVDVNWKHNYIRGHYPSWKVHFEGEWDNQYYRIDLDCESDVNGDANTYRFDNTYLHHFACLRVRSKGTIAVGETSHQIEGSGYYEHFWGFLDLSTARGWQWYWTPSTAKDGLALNIGMGANRDKTLPMTFVIFTPDGKTYETIEKFTYHEIEVDEHGTVEFASKFSIEEKTETGELKAVVTRNPSSYRRLNQSPFGPAIFITGPAKLEGYIKWQGKKYDITASAFGSAMLFDLNI